MPMTSIEAAGFVDHVAVTWNGQTWPSTTRKAWVDALSDPIRGVELGIAGRVLARLRDDGIPKIGLSGFVHACRASARPAVDTPRPHCDVCGGDGWLVRDVPHPLRPSLTVQESEPCNACARGQQIAAGGVR